MRTRVQSGVLAALLLSAHSACRRPANVDNLATLDTLLRATDSVTTLIKAIDVAGIRRLDSLYHLKAERINARMRDTLRKEDALALGNYVRTMSRYPANVEQGSNSVLKRCELGHNQLISLRSDVEKSLLEPEAELKYIADERAALEQVMHDAGTVSASAAGILRDEARYGATVDSMLVRDTLAVP